MLDLRRYNKRTVVVLGASGFIGRWVARLLSNSGAELILCVRNPSTSQEIFRQYDVKGQIYAIDLKDSSHVRKCLRSVQPDIVFNLAAYGVDRNEQDESIAEGINVSLVRVICQELEKISKPDWAGRSLVHVGTAMEYGRITGDLKEDSPEIPETLYGRTKLAGTRVVARMGLASGSNGITARLFAIYGPGEPLDRLLPSLIYLASHPVELPLTAGMHERDFVYVEDAAEALIRLGISQGIHGEIVNVATGKLTSIRLFAETAADMLGVPREYLAFGALPTRAEEMAHQPVNNGRLFQLTGWLPEISVPDGIQKTLDFSA
jgi:UDP-glucose 4-epimerase